MRIVVLGLSLSSSWGNGHATTWRALTKGLAAHGDDVLFLERRAPWYAAHRDLDAPDWCALAFYDGLDELSARWRAELAQADLVLVGSYTPQGIEVLDFALDVAPGRTAFYDIDTPVTLAALEAGAPTYIAPRQIPRLAVYFSFTGGPALTLLERRYGAPRARALYCCVDETLYGPRGENKIWDLGYLGTYGADRQPGLEELLIAPARMAPHLRFVVAGPQYPPDIDWPANVERIEHLAPGDHAAFYARQRFTLNVTRADMIRAGHSPSVRLFEAGCCAAPIISDEWPGLEEVYAPGKEILIARNRNDVLAILSHMDERARQSIAEGARARVLAAHLGAQRARELRAEASRALRAGAISQQSFAGA